MIQNTVNPETLTGGPWIGEQSPVDNIADGLSILSDSFRSGLDRVKGL